MTSKLAPPTLALVLTLLAPPAYGQPLDCYTFLRGTEERLGLEHPPSSLSDAQLNRALSSRVCVKTFVQIDALRPLLTAEPTLARLLRRVDSLQQPSRRLRDASDEALSEALTDLFVGIQDLPANSLGTIALRLRRGGPALGGYDPLQAELFARYLQVVRLYEDDNPRALLGVVDELRATTRVPQLVDTGRTDIAETGTYYRAETLWSALQAFELDALVLLARPGAPEVVSHIARRLDIPESSLTLLPTPDMYLLLDAAVPSLARLANNIDLPAIRRIPRVAGAAASPEHIDIYLQSQRGLPAKVLRYTRFTRELQLLDAEAVFDDHVTTVLRQNSTNDFNLVNIVASGPRFRLQLADATLELTETEVRSLQHGVPLPSSHPLTQRLLASDAPLVVYSHPLMHDNSHYLRQAEQLAFAIQQSYPSARVYRDDFDEIETPIKVRAIEDLRFEGLDRLLAVVAQDSFGVEDWRILQNRTEELASLGVEVVRWTTGDVWEHGTDRAVIVITGHIDDALAAFVDELGRAGVFEDNYIVFGSCYEDLSSTLVKAMNTVYGAKGTFRFDGAINAHDVGQAVVDLAERLRDGQGRLGLSPVLRRTIRGVGLRGIWTVCWNDLDKLRTHG